MGFFDNLTKGVVPVPSPAPTPADELHPSIKVGAMAEDAPQAPAARMRYKVLGAWAFDQSTRTILDHVDPTTYGVVMLEGDRSATVGGTIELTRDEARVVGKRFALSVTE